MQPNRPALISLLLVLGMAGCSGSGSGGSDDSTLGLNDDRYDAVGNTPLEVGVAAGTGIALRRAGSVLDNDGAGSGLSVTSVTPGMGTVAMNADGSFTYAPPAGFTGSDSFTYQATDGSETATATVVVQLEGRVWYVDNTAPGGSGVAADPFARLQDAQVVAASGDTIYLAGDGSDTGADTGFSATVSSLSLVGAGVPLEVNGSQLAPAGTIPILSNSAGPVISLQDVDTIRIAGLVVEQAPGDAMEVDNSTGIVLEQVTIRDSGASAIVASGDRVTIELLEVAILDVDRADPDVSDDAVRIAPNVSGVLTMHGGSIDGVPGRLGDGIVMQNVDPSRPVDLTLIVTGASFSNIGQDAIRVDNESGLVLVDIGGLEPAAANVLSDIGFRGIVVEADGDPGNRINRILLANNVVAAAHEAIQVRGIDDISQVTILDNTIDSSTSTATRDAIDMQQDLGSQAEARIRGNQLFGSSTATDTGVRVRLFDGARLALEMADNSLDDFETTFDLASRETSGLVTSRVDATVTDNVLTNVAPPELAMWAASQDPTSEFCLDLRNNSAVSEYRIDAPAGLFELALGSQVTTVVQGTIGGSPASCTVPAF